MDDGSKGSGDQSFSSQGPTGSDYSGDAKPDTDPTELANKEMTDPNQVSGDEPESGAGYGNHAMPDLPEAGI